MAVVDKNRLYFIRGDKTETIVGIQGSKSKTHGLCLRWKYGSAAKEDACMRLVRRGSKNSGGTGFFVRYNGIDFEAAARMYSNYHAALDDTGNIYEVGSDTYATDDGWYFGKGIYADENITAFKIDLCKPWTVAFKVKGTANTGSPYPSHILYLSSTGTWTPKQKSTVGEVFAFGMFSSGNLMFRDYFNDLRVSNPVDSWRDIKITFYPTTDRVYNADLDQDIRPVNFVLTDNDEVVSGSTYYVSFDEDNASPDWQTYEFKLSVNGGKWSQGITDYTSPFHGYIKYLSIAQDEQGYSDYLRDTHKVALYFD